MFVDLILCGRLFACDDSVCAGSKLCCADVGKDSTDHEPQKHDKKYELKYHS